MNMKDETVEKIAHDLHADLPEGRLPVLVKIIALLLSIGGLSISASVFTDFVSPREATIFTQIGRLIVGLVMITVAYGIFRRKRWSLWLYGLVIFIGLFVNFRLILIPLATFIYLYVHRKTLTTTLIEKYLADFFVSLGKLFGVVKKELTK